MAHVGLWLLHRPQCYEMVCRFSLPCSCMEPWGVKICWPPCFFFLPGAMAIIGVVLGSSRDLATTPIVSLIGDIWLTPTRAISPEVISS